ncbi:MAG TPA: nucleotidyltransferase domain-containing protein [Candidatus Nanoarchaeia archaeon]|nr:nucleotidyltransferase domain-containing protein [Candidatus Nanoarchaeia archaeon]
MLQKNNRYKILKLFFENPISNGIGFQLREISRKVKVAPPSVKKYLNELEKEGLITKGTLKIFLSYPLYYANRDNNYFLFLKKIDTIQSIKESGLLDYLSDKCMPDVIILFGSASRGEDLKDSDIDLFVQSKEKKLDLKTYEKQLNRKINVFFNDNFNLLSKELKNNIINGIILKGYLKVF